MSRPTYSIIVLWRKFICDKSASGMLINPLIVWTFSRQKWSSNHLQFRSSLGGVKIKYMVRNIPHLPTVRLTSHHKINKMHLFHGSVHQFYKTIMKLVNFYENKISGQQGLGLGREGLWRATRQGPLISTCVPSGSSLDARLCMYNRMTV